MDVFLSPEWKVEVRRGLSAYQHVRHDEAVLLNHIPGRWGASKKVPSRNSARKQWIFGAFSHRVSEKTEKPQRLLTTLKTMPDQSSRLRKKHRTSKPSGRPKKCRWKLGPGALISRNRRYPRYTILSQRVDAKGRHWYVRDRNDL